MTAPATGDSQPWTIGRLLNWTAEYLDERGVDDARLAAEVLLAHAADLPRIQLYARFDQTLDAGRIDRFRDLVRRAAAHEPIAYLVGEKEFFSLSFRVTPDVLIPRPETETLVECVLDHCVQAKLDAPCLFEIGAGSGCVIIALLVHLTEARAVASDISTEALAIARENAQRHGVRDRLTLIEADRCHLPPETVPEGGFEVILSNPPYVAETAMNTLAPTVREYEPPMALTDRADGLTFYRDIGREGPALLASEGVVFVEIADDQGPAARQAVESGGHLACSGAWKDRVTGRERVLRFVRTDAA